MSEDCLFGNVRYLDLTQPFTNVVLSLRALVDLCACWY